MDGLNAYFFNNVKARCVWCGTERETGYDSEFICQLCKKSIKVKGGKEVAPSLEELKKCSEKTLKRLVSNCVLRKDIQLALTILRLQNASDGVRFSAARYLLVSKENEKEATGVICALADKKDHEALKYIYFQYEIGYPLYGECDIKKYCKYLAEDYGDKGAAEALKKMEADEKRLKQWKKEDELRRKDYLSGKIPMGKPQAPSNEFNSSREPTFNGMKYSYFKSSKDGKPLYENLDGDIVNENGEKQDPFDIYLPVGDGKTYEP